ncbi:MAG: 16S rRNA (uracil(1498)-N(3))-methyltransferase [Steroidobacteraceae bacterium]|nr:16S rRNA (uracil(1498)-N(3))-methyltransferase [Steroidobacteraceae bacterium]
MRLTRVHVPLPLADGATLALPERAATHLVRVLRLRAGDRLAVFDGAGREHDATLAQVRGDRVDVVLGAPRAAAAESPLAITLVQGISRGERMDYAIQKATELGVRRIVPVFAERSVVRLDASQAERKLEHWRGVATSACEQCGRARLPELLPPRRYLEYLAEARPPAEASHVRLVLAPEGTHAARDLPERLDAAELLVGPEGGLTTEEESLALARGFVGLRLGPRILRTETAAAAAIAVLQALRGDLA